MPGRSSASASGREPAARERAGPVRLREHVALAHERAHRLRLGRIAQIDVRLQLADPGIEVRRRPQVGQVLARHPQHVGAVLGERARAGRSRQHAREIEHAHARERPVPRGQRPRRRIADLHDLEQRQARRRSASAAARAIPPRCARSCRSRRPRRARSRARARPTSRPLSRRRSASMPARRGSRGCGRAG